MKKFIGYIGMYLCYYLGNTLSMLKIDKYNEFIINFIFKIQDWAKLNNPWKTPIDKRWRDVKNPVFEDELRKTLDNIWKNRTNVNWSKLNLLEKIANYKGGKF